MSKHPAGTVLVATGNAPFGIIRAVKGDRFRCDGTGLMVCISDNPKIDPAIDWCAPQTDYDAPFVVETPKAPKKAPVRFVTRNGETWVGRGHVNTRKTGTVTAVRVAKGDPSGRGGQFHGATNFVEVQA